MSSDVMVKVQDISKCFEMYEKPVHRLYQTLCAGHKKFYKEFWALKNINFEVHKGECVGIIGRNGAGKSTLLQVITGTLQPTTGTVETHGRVAALLELGSGFNPEFTGRENVYMYASLLGLSVQEIDAKYQSIVEFADIGDFINQPVKTYSSGMYVRLAFAVVAHVDADIMIIDEALAVGDAFFTQKCMRVIRKFREEHTILFVSHDTGAVVNLCNRAILLDHGEIAKAGTAKEIAEYYLSQQFKTTQGSGEISCSEENNNKPEEAQEEENGENYRDMRQNFMVTTNLRNDIELLQYNPESASFGTGQADVLDVKMLDENGACLSWVVGGEMVKVQVKAKVYRDMDSPIVGILFKDRLGQGLFTFNTCIHTLQHPFPVKAGDVFLAEFEFRMPVLYRGDYTITISVAEGTQKEHVQHKWLHDGFLFKSHAPEPMALVGLPLKSLTLRKEISNE